MIHPSKKTLIYKLKKITKIILFPLYFLIIAIIAIMNKIYYHIIYNKNEKNNIKNCT